MLIVGAEASLESVVVRDVGYTAADDGGGLGVSIQYDHEAGVPSYGVVRGCVIERTAYAGLLVYNADATVESTLVRGVATTASGAFGDGIALVSYGGVASASLSDCRAEDNARAGLATFGAMATVSGTTLHCNAIPIDGETVEGVAFGLQNLGGNACGCPAEDQCKVATSNLQPPQPL